MGGSSGGGSGTTTMDVAPWLKPYLTGGGQEGINPANALMPNAQSAYLGLRGYPDPAGQIPVFQGLNPMETVGLMGQHNAVPQLAQLGAQGQQAATGMLDPASAPWLQQAAQGAMAGPAGGYNATQLAGLGGYNAAQVGNLGGYDATLLAGLGGYNASTASTSPGLEQMLSGQVNTSIYDPVSRAMTDRTVADFRESVLPALRQEAQNAGQYGGSMHDRASGIAAGKLGEALAAQNAGLYAQGAEQALADRRTGAQYGYGLTSQNLGAQNQAMQFNAGMGSQAAILNQAAANQASQYNQGLGAQGQLANQAANNQALQYNAGMGSQAAMLNQAAANQAGQFNAQLGATQRAGDQGMFTSMYGPAMASRGAALGLLPQVGQGLLAPGQTLAATGEAFRGADEFARQQQIQMMQQQRLQPFNDIQSYLGLLTPFVGGGIGQQTGGAGGGSRAIGALGGAATGAAVGGALTAKGGALAGSAFGPYGTLIGAGVGALAGYFS